MRARERDRLERREGRVRPVGRVERVGLVGWIERVSLITLVAVLVPMWALAQDRFDAGAHVAVARSSEFDATDTGIGGWLSWHPTALIGAVQVVVLSILSARKRGHPAWSSLARRVVVATLPGIYVGAALTEFARLRGSDRASWRSAEDLCLVS